MHLNKERKGKSEGIYTTKYMYYMLCTLLIIPTTIVSKMAKPMGKGVRNNDGEKTKKKQQGV